VIALAGTARDWGSTMNFWTMVRTRLFGSEAEEAESCRTAAIDASTDHRISEDGPTEPGSGSTGDDDPPADPSILAARQERAASRILEDERLRGDLTDDEFQPLLDWALNVTDRLVAGTGGLSDADADARIDAGLQVIRDVVGAAGAAIAAHAEGDAERRSSELAYLSTQWSSMQVQGVETEPEGVVSSRLASLAERLDAEPDLPGVEVSTLIVQALTPATDNNPRSDAPAASQGRGDKGPHGRSDAGVPGVGDAS
jgi:hypothetical protein